MCSHRKGHGGPSICGAQRNVPGAPQLSSEQHVSVHWPRVCPAAGGWQSPLRHSIPLEQPLPTSPTALTGKSMAQARTKTE